MNTYRSLIVGAWHHPPAQAILDYLTYNAELLLRAEPQNPYDPNAIQIWVPRSAIEKIDLKDELDSRLRDFGTNLPELLKESMWHLGYIPRHDAEQLTNTYHFPASTDVKGEYFFQGDGKPRVSFEF